MEIMKFLVPSLDDEFCPKIVAICKAADFRAETVKQSIINQDQSDCQRNQGSTTSMRIMCLCVAFCENFHLMKWYYATSSILRKVSETVNRNQE